MQYNMTIHDAVIVRSGVVFSQSKSGEDHFTQCFASLSDDGLLEVVAVDESNMSSFNRGIELSSISSIQIEVRKSFHLISLSLYNLCIARLLIVNADEANEWFQDLMDVQTLSKTSANIWDNWRKYGLSGEFRNAISICPHLSRICSQTKNGNLLLHEICGEICSKKATDEDIKLMKLILKGNPAAPRHRNWKNMLPLHVVLISSEHERVDQVLNILLEYYPDSQYEETSENEFPIHLASLKSSFVAATCLLASTSPLKRVGEFLDEPSPLVTLSNHGETPLHCAIRNEPCNLNLVFLLVAVEPKALLVKDKNGLSPLHVAAILERYDIFINIKNEPLFEAAVTIRDSRGETPVDILTSKKRTDDTALLNKLMESLTCWEYDKETDLSGDYDTQYYSDDSYIMNIL